MNQGPALPTDQQAAVAVEPGDGALDLPAMTTQPLLGFDAGARNPGRNSSTTAGSSVLLGMVPFVGMELAGALARTTARTCDGLHGIEHGLQHVGIRHVGGGQSDRQWQAVPVSQDVVLAARTPAVARVGACFWAPLFAWTSDESKQARSQLMRPC